MDTNEMSPVIAALGPIEIATLDTETSPSPGVRKVTQGEKVLLLSSFTEASYADYVRERLIELGKDPDNFVVGDLPWGVKVQNTPVIIHKDKHYLQTIRLEAGTSRYYIGNTDTELSASAFEKPRAFTGQGLPPAEQVYVRAYKFENIKKIVIHGVTIGD